MLQTLWPKTEGARAALIAHAAALAGGVRDAQRRTLWYWRTGAKTVSLARGRFPADCTPLFVFLSTFRWAIDLLDGISGAIVKSLECQPQGHEAGIPRATDTFNRRERG